MPAQARPPATFIALHGTHSSVLLECPSGEAPLWRYWGPRLPDGASPGAELRGTRPLPSFMLDTDQPLTVAPSFGVGWFGQSALLAHRAGRDFAQAFTRCDITWTLPGQAVVLQLHDEVAQLRLDIHLTLDPASDVLTIKSRLTNAGERTLDVSWLAAATLPLPGQAQQVRSYAGQHNHEFLLQTDALGRSLWQRENRRGRTSHDCFPGAVVTTAGATEHTGLVFGAHLAWSGNHRQCIEWLHDGQYQWQLGEWLAPGEALLAPGQSLETPEVVASCSQQGLNGLAANFHHELRHRLAWPGGRMRPRPVHLNTWEAFYFKLQPAAVMDLASAAAEVGIERFVLDDGWFQGRDHDRAGLGDWWTDRTKFPEGLGPLAAHVNALGMEFGLWVEPEMLNPDSELFRTHPDLGAADRRAAADHRAQPAGARHLAPRGRGLCLRQARPPALSELPITYLKWDHNRDLTTAALAGGTGGAGYRAQVHAAYALMAKLRAAHPALEIESCSGGGGRIDFAVLRHTQRVWGSDCIDALSAHRHPARLSASFSRRKFWARTSAPRRPTPPGATRRWRFAPPWRSPATSAWSSTCATWMPPKNRPWPPGSSATKPGAINCTRARCGAAKAPTTWCGRRTAMPRPTMCCCSSSAPRPARTATHRRCPCPCSTAARCTGCSSWCPLKATAR